MKMSLVYLSLGSNVGDKIKNLQLALDQIDSKIGSVITISNLYENPPVGFKGDLFYNCCISVKTKLTPTLLLNELLNIEIEGGRLRDNKKGYKSRTERSKHLMDMGIPLNTDSTLKGQFVFAAERASELLCDKIITDRTVIDVMAFSALSKSMNANESYFLNAALSNLIDDYDHLFYVSPVGVKMEDNGVRETDIIYRDNINKKILEILDWRDVKYTTIQGTTEERIKAVKSVVFS